MTYATRIAKLEAAIEPGRVLIAFFDRSAAGEYVGASCGGQRFDRLPGESGDAFVDRAFGYADDNIHRIAVSWEAPL